MSNTSKITMQLRAQYAGRVAKDAQLDFGEENHNHAEVIRKVMLTLPPRKKDADIYDYALAVLPFFSQEQIVTAWTHPDRKPTIGLIFRHLSHSGWDLRDNGNYCGCPLLVIICQEHADPTVIEIVTRTIRSGRHWSNLIVNGVVDVPLIREIIDVQRQVDELYDRDPVAQFLEAVKRQ